MNLLCILCDYYDRILEILSDLDFSGLIQASKTRDTLHHKWSLCGARPTIEAWRSLQPKCHHPGRKISGSVWFIDGTEDHIPTTGLVIFSKPMIVLSRPMEGSNKLLIPLSIKV